MVISGIVAGDRRSGGEVGGRDARGPPRTAGKDPQPIGAQVHLHRAVEVGAKDAGPDVVQAAQGRRGGVPVVVAGPDGDEGERRPDGREEQRAGRGGAAVVRDLEDVDPRQIAREQRRVHVVLGVAG
jgi:hypothetical protein